MSKFVTRHIQVPDYLDVDSDEQPPAIPANWGERRHPAIPAELLEGLSRPPPPGYSDPPVAVTSGTIGRASLSLGRTPSSLPTLAPHSPLDLAYPDSDGFSTARTSAPSSPTLSRSNSRRLDQLDPFSHLPTNPTPALDASISTPTPSTSSKRSMFRSLAFGRSSRSSMTPSPNSSLAPSASLPIVRPRLGSQHGGDRSSSSSSLSRQQQQQQQHELDDPPLSSLSPASNASSIGLSTVSDPPLVDSRVAAPSSTASNDPPPLPPPSAHLQSLNRRPSRQQLAMGGGGGGGGGEARGYSSHRTSHSARAEADRWFFDARAAGSAFAPAPTPVVGSTTTETARDERDDAAANGANPSSELQVERDAYEVDDRDEGGGAIAWARRGEQYTHDLYRTTTKARELDREFCHRDDDDDDDDDDDGDGDGPLVESAESPETRFHDAPQSPDALRTVPTLPSLPSLPLLDPPLVALGPPQTDAARTSSSPIPAVPPPPPQHRPDPVPVREQIPFRRDGKLSLPVYSDYPLEDATEVSMTARRRNRSDGDGLDDDEQAELESRLNAFDLSGRDRGDDHDDRPSSRLAPLPPDSPNSLADFVVAVVGPRNVGKSSVVKKGLRPRSTEVPTVIQEDHVGNRVTTTTTTFTIGGVRRTIEVLEIDMHLLRYNDEGVIWPDGLPQCEGAMLCYDSTDPDALSSLSVLLKAFWTRGSDVPLIVLACKALGPGDRGRNATDPTEAAKVCNVYGAGIVTLDGGIDDANRKTKESFKYVIRQIMENRGEMVRPASPVASNSPAMSRQGSAQQYATTSRSPFNVAGTPSSSRRPSAYSDDAHLAQQPALDAYDIANAHHGDGLGLGLSVVQEAPLGGGHGSADASSAAAITDGASALPRPVPRASASATTEEPLSPKSQAPTYVSDSVPAYDSSDRRRSQRLSTAELSPTTRHSPVDEPERRTSTTKATALDLFFSREDMIDKFLYAAVTGNDEAYVTLFLIAYRRFARPYDVLEKLIERFEFVAQKLKSDPLLSRFAQMKICGVLSIWMQSYPGDFSGPSTFGLLSPFLHSLLPSGATWVAHYALELIPLLAAISAQPDPEAAWALPDKGVSDSPHPADAAASRSGSSDVKPDPITPSSRRPSIAPSYDSAGSQTNLSVPVPGRSSDSPVHSSSSAGLSPQTGSGSDAGTLDTQESGGGDQSLGTGAGLSTLNPRPPPRGSVGVTASALIEVSNMVMEMREEDVALQITRLAWEMFGGMTPRDLLRHVLAPRDPANPRLALRDSETNVVKSIAFVNYLANWTASLILVQGKLKQRARILEKMLLIALALREQENFDSLMGVLAGLNAQPIFRLSDTFDLVTNKLDGDPRGGAGGVPRRPELVESEPANRLPKKLRSLNRLMAATKSFSAYRLALANSGVNMIPYLGVHLQDITVVNEIKGDLRDGKVNWTKFSQMGRSAAIVLDCSRIAPTLPVDKLVERAIVNVPVLDEERQYTLSYQHQPRQSDKTSGTRSRLRTLAKSTFASGSSS